MEYQAVRASGTSLHAMLPFWILRVHHAGIADRVEGVDQVRAGKFPLQAFHQRLVKISEEFKGIIGRRRFGKSDRLYR
jgi:hypothetical protein